MEFKRIYLAFSFSSLSIVFLRDNKEHVSMHLFSRDYFCVKYTWGGGGEEDQLLDFHIIDNWCNSAKTAYGSAYDI